MTEGALCPRPATDVERIVHELRVHQIELEAQNEALRQAHCERDALEARYLDLYEFAPVGYCTLNEKWSIVQANVTASVLFGVPKPAVAKRMLSRFVHPESQDAYYRYRRGIVDGRAPAACELQLLRPDGAPVWVLLAVTPSDAGDGIPEFRATLSDISDRKRLDGEKAKLEAEVQQAQKMESIGRLAGGVAHDFNNMLGVILGYVTLSLDDVSASPALRDNLTQIRAAAERSADLTRQLLAFARKQTIVPQVLDLRAHVADMVRMLERLIGETIALRFRPPPSLWPVCVDPSQIDQILANLCVNARDAIAGAGIVTVETRNVALEQRFCAGKVGSVPGDYVKLSVSDDGCGMSEEVMSHLFEPFFTTKGVGQGTGLGLATVFGIVRQNDGFVSVSSKPGVGTTFDVYLPRHGGPAERPTAPTDAPA